MLHRLVRGAVLAEADAGVARVHTYVLGVPMRAARRDGGAHVVENVRNVPTYARVRPPIVMPLTIAPAANSRTPKCRVWPYSWPCHVAVERRAG